MVKGLIWSLIAAAAFFTAGGISAEILGTNASKLSTFREFGNDFTELLLDSDTDGTWHFDNHSEIALGLSGTRADIFPVNGDQISLSVSSHKASVGIERLSVKVALNEDGSCLAISVSRHGLFLMDFSAIEVKIGLPKDTYNKLQLQVGSGTVTAESVDALENEITVNSGKLIFTPSSGFNAERMDISMGSGTVTAEGVNAYSNEITVGSGRMIFTSSPNFTANNMSIFMGSGNAEVKNSAVKNLNIDIGSGSLIMDTAATERFDIGMGSGKFEVNGLSGSGNIDVASGSGIARFSDASGINGSTFNLASGKLGVYLPSNTNALINTSVSSGSVVVDCGGVEDKLRSGDDAVTLGNGGAVIFADVASGKLSILDNIAAADIAVVEAVEIKPGTLHYEIENAAEISSDAITHIENIEFTEKL